VALLLAVTAHLQLLAEPAGAADEATVRVRSIEGQEVTLDVSPPASFGDTFLPASAFRVLEGDQPRQAAIRRWDDDDLQVVLVVDPILDAAALGSVRSSLIGFVRRLPPGTPIGVVVADEGREPVPPSDDADEVIATLAGIRRARRGSMDASFLRALDQFPGRSERGVIVAVNGGHFERPGPASEALERRLPTTPVSSHLIDVRQAALGPADVPPPVWMGLTGRYTVAERLEELGPLLDRIAGELANTYEVRTTVQGVGVAPLSVEITAGANQAVGVTIADLEDPPKPPREVVRRAGWVLPVLVGLAIGIVVLGALLYLPRRRRRRRLSAELRRAGAPHTTRAPLRGATAQPVDRASARAPSLAGAAVAGGPVRPASGGPVVGAGGVAGAPSAGDGDDAGSAVARAPMRARSRLGGEQVPGVASVAALLRGGRPVREVVVAPSLATEDLEALLALAAGRHVRVTRRTGGAAARELDHHGVVASAAPLRPVRLEDLCRPRPGQAAVVLGLPAEAGDEELGTVLAEADRAGITGVLVHERTGPVVTPAVADLAAGAIERVGMAPVRDLGPAAARMRAAGALLLGVDRLGAPPHALAEALAREPLDRPVVVLLGGRQGLGRQVANRCHAVGSIAAHEAVWGSVLLAQWRRCAPLLELRRLREGGPGLAD
jgi:tRNA G18 (ribose-2'-O)-methylase SpoU